MKINNISNAAPATIFIITVACGITCTTVAHYAEAWGVGYLVAIAFAFAAAFVTALAEE